MFTGDVTRIIVSVLGVNRCFNLKSVIDPPLVQRVMRLGLPEKSASHSLPCFGFLAFVRLFSQLKDTLFSLNVLLGEWVGRVIRAFVLLAPFRCISFLKTEGGQETEVHVLASGNHL